MSGISKRNQFWNLTVPDLRGYSARLCSTTVSNLSPFSRSHPCIHRSDTVFRVGLGCIIWQIKVSTSDVVSVLRYRRSLRLPTEYGYTVHPASQRAPRAEPAVNTSSQWRKLQLKLFRLVVASRCAVLSATSEGGRGQHQAGASRHVGRKWAALLEGPEWLSAGSDREAGDGGYGEELVERKRYDLLLLFGMTLPHTLRGPRDIASTSDKRKCADNQSSYIIDCWCLCYTTLRFQRTRSLPLPRLPTGSGNGSFPTTPNSISTIPLLRRKAGFNIGLVACMEKNADA